MKKVTSHNKIDDVKNELVKFLRDEIEAGKIFEFRLDLLAMVMPEFIGSERFGQLGTDRRKDLFEQYHALVYFLTTIEKYCERI